MAVPIHVGKIKPSRYAHLAKALFTSVNISSFTQWKMSQHVAIRNTVRIHYWEFVGGKILRPGIFRALKIQPVCPYHSFIGSYNVPPPTTHTLGTVVLIFSVLWSRKPFFYLVVAGSKRMSDSLSKAHAFNSFNVHGVTFSLAFSTDIGNFL